MADIPWRNRILIVTNPRKNLKGVNLSQSDKIIYRKRAIIWNVQMMNSRIQELLQVAACQAQDNI